ncbi:MAG TPA: ClpXP protease specificity-enhancing factor [Nitrosospira sp.]|jgi:stringent starvation protein B|nr:ClpXP protease specificity-enhancing factor [Nitrosospira sp.]
MRELSTKPYLIRAIYEWCSDSDHTPYISVKVDDQTRVPEEYVKDGEIILNISQDAAYHLTLGNDLIQFSARFNGVTREISIPVSAIQGIFAKESSQGIIFPPEEQAAAPQADPGIEGAGENRTSPRRTSSKGEKPRLQIIK